MSELKLRPRSRDLPPHSKVPASEGRRYTSEEKNGPRTDLKVGHYKVNTEGAARGRPSVKPSRATQEPRRNTGPGCALREEELERIPVVGFPA
jgi:hypothetical protein